MNSLFTKLLFLLALGVVSFTVHAQDTTKVDQYCQVTLAPAGGFSSKISMEIDSSGQVRSLNKDYRLKDANGKTKIFNSNVDALNYVGRLGWKLVGFTTDYKYGVCYCVFKKEFLKSAIEP
jgi:hypothetical protein